MPLCNDHRPRSELVLNVPSFVCTACFVSVPWEMIAEFRKADCLTSYDALDRLIRWHFWRKERSVPV